MSLNFTLKSWSAWSPGLDNHADWSSWAHISQRKISDVENPGVKDLPMMLRRRLSPLGRMAMRVAHDVKLDETPHLVFSSRYGETQQTLKLLQSLALNEPVSPVGFSTSVHNALAGLLSISSKNTKPHTAVSAGKASFCAALLEAICLLHDTPRDPVLLVHYDNPLPEFYAPFGDETVEPLALALLLEKGSSNAESSFSMNIAKSKVCNNTEDAALNFIRYIIGPDKNWSWSNDATEWNFSRL